jgi:hypothetical protein
MKPIWGRDRNQNWHQVESYTDRDKPLVIGKAIGEPGYCIYHVKSGGSVVTRPKLADLRPMLPKLLKLRGIDWSADFSTIHGVLLTRGALPALRFGQNLFVTISTEDEAS